MHQVEDLWNDAVSKFNETVEKDASKVSIPRLDSPQQLCDFIESHHEKFNAFMSRGAKLRKGLMYALAPVKLLGEITSGGTSLVRSPELGTFYTSKRTPLSPSTSVSGEEHYKFERLQGYADPTTLGFPAKPNHLWSSGSTSQCKFGAQDSWKKLGTKADLRLRRMSVKHTMELQTCS